MIKNSIFTSETNQQQGIFFGSSHNALSKSNQAPVTSKNEALNSSEKNYESFKQPLTPSKLIEESS